MHFLFSKYSKYFLQLVKKVLYFRTNSTPEPQGGAHCQSAWRVDPSSRAAEKMWLCPLFLVTEPTLYITPGGMFDMVVEKELLPVPLLLGGWVEFEVELLAAELFDDLVDAVL